MLIMRSRLLGLLSKVVGENLVGIINGGLYRYCSVKSVGCCSGWLSSKFVTTR